MMRTATSSPTIAIHAPARNLVTRTTSSTEPVESSPIVLITRERIILRRARASVSVRSNRVQCRTMPIWLNVKETNTPTMYSWIRAVTSAWNAMIEHERRHRQEQDAVGERQPVAAGVQLARQVTVLRQDRAEHREAVERGVGRQHQDERGHGGDQQEADGEAAEHRLRELRDQRLLVVVRGRPASCLAGSSTILHAGLLGQHDHAHEQRHRDRAQQQQRGGGVAGLGLLETPARRC